MDKFAIRRYSLGRPSNFPNSARWLHATLLRAQASICNQLKSHAQNKEEHVHMLGIVVTICVIYHLVFCWSAPRPQ